MPQRTVLSTSPASSASSTGDQQNSPVVRSTVLTTGAFVGGSVVVIDQLTKASASALGNTAVTHPVTNPEFSLGLASLGSLSLMVLVTIAGVAAFGTYVLRQTLRGRLAPWVPGLLIGGAVSNLVDRLLLGAVRDFIPSVWVVWNLADLAVFLGIAGYAWGHLRRSDSTIDVGEVIPA